MAVITRNVDLSVVGANGGGWVTDLGAPIPATPVAYDSAIPAGMSALGAVSEEGLGYGFDEDSQAFVAWGQLTPYRTQITRSLRTFTVNLWETNRGMCKSIMYRVPVASVTPNITTGNYTFNETAAPAPDRRSWIFDVMDGNTIERFFVPVGQVTDRDDVQFRPDEMAAYALTITAYADSSGVTVYHLGHVVTTSS